MENIKEIPVKPFGQRDSRWASEQLGTCDCTIGTDGCLITCVAILANYFGKEETPSTINQKLKQVNGYASGCLYKWYEGVTKIYSDIICQGLFPVPYPLDEGQEAEIDSQLNNGYPVICEVDYNPATTAVENHWVILVGKKDGIYIMIDPWTGRKGQITKYGSQKITINYFVEYEGPKGATMSDKMEIEKETFEKLVTKSGRYDHVVEYLGINKDPLETPFDEVRSIIGGYKSRETDLMRQLAAKTTELDNRVEQVSRLKGQLSENEKLRNALNDKLNEALEKSVEMKGLYEGRMKDLQGQIDTLAEEKGTLANKIGQLEVEIQQLKKGQGSVTFGDFLRSLWDKIKDIRLKGGD